MTDTRLPGRHLLPPAGARVFFLGIAGAGMSGLARLFAARGFAVWGSDTALTPGARRLTDHGITLVETDETGRAQDADLVVYTSAAPEDHPVLEAARRADVPVLKRARAMGALLNDRDLVAVCGTHGKTTVTAMTARVMEKGGLDPVGLVGGRVEEWDGNARVGAGPAIAEADEYDRSFLQLSPSLAIVTSVEPEHLECYESPEHLVSSFRAFAARASDRAGILACTEAPGVASAVEGLSGVSTYGLDADADYRVTVLSHSGTRQACRFECESMAFEFGLDTPGEHNAQNAAAALAAGVRLGLVPDVLSAALSGFRGVDRRLQLVGTRNGRVIVDDYAHHPTEVRVSVAAAREAWPDRRLAVVFQPHLYSRTSHMAAEFASALAGADEARVLPIYPAREAPMPGVTSRLVTDAAGGAASPVTAPEVAEWIDGLEQETVVLFMGAGDVTRLAHAVAAGKGGNGVDD